jgi:hypothetical protein
LTTHKHIKNSLEDVSSRPFIQLRDINILVRTPFSNLPNYKMEKEKGSTTEA